MAGTVVIYVPRHSPTSGLHVYHTTNVFYEMQSRVSHHKLCGTELTVTRNAAEILNLHLSDDCGRSAQSSRPHTCRCLSLFATIRNNYLASTNCSRHAERSLVTISHAMHFLRSHSSRYVLRHRGPDHAAALPLLQYHQSCGNALQPSRPRNAYLQ